MDAFTFEVQHTFEGAYNAVFSPDSQLMALEFRLKKVQIIKLASFSSKGELGDNLNIVLYDHESFNDICFSPDSKKIAYINQNCVELWGTDDCKKIGIFEESERSYAVQFSSDGKYIVWGDIDGRITICESDPNDSLSARLQIGEENSIQSVILTVHFIMDDKFVIIGCGNGHMAIFSLADAEKEKYESNIYANIYSISEFRDGENYYLTVSCDGGLFYIWDMKKKEFICINGTATSIEDIKYISDNNQVVVAGINSKALIIECTTKKCVGYVDNGEAGIIHKIAYSQKANKIAVTSIAGNVSIYNANNFSCEKQYVAGDFLHGSSIAFDEEGRRILSSSIGSSEIKIYDMQTGNIRKINSPNYTNYSTVFYPDEKHILTVGQERCIQINVEKEMEKKRFYGYTNPYVETNLLDRLERRIMKVSDE